MKRVLKASEENRYYKPTLEVLCWSMHTVSNCEVCEHTRRVRKGGHKKTLVVGRSCDDSVHSAIRHIMKIYPNSLFPDVDRCSLTFTSTSSSCINFNDLQCCICEQIVDHPVYFTECKRLVCEKCCCEAFKQGNRLQCPCCDSNHIRDLSQITEPPPLILKVLANLEITCSICTKTISSGIAVIIIL